MVYKEDNKIYIFETNATGVELCSWEKFKTNKYENMYNKIVWR